MVVRLVSENENKVVSHLREPLFINVQVSYYLLDIKYIFISPPTALSSQSSSRSKSSSESRTDNMLESEPEIDFNALKKRELLRQIEPVSLKHIN